MHISRLRQTRLASFVDRTEDVACFRTFLSERDKIARVDLENQRSSQS